MPVTQIRGACAECAQLAFDVAAMRIEKACLTQDIAFDEQTRAVRSRYVDGGSGIFGQGNAGKLGPLAIGHICLPQPGPGVGETRCVIAKCDNSADFGRTMRNVVELVEGAAIHDDIGIQQQHVIAAGECKAAIYGFYQTEMAVIGQHEQIRLLCIGFQQFTHAGLRRSIIDQNQPIERGGALRQDGVDTIPCRRHIAVDRHNDVQPGCLAPVRANRLPSRGKPLAAAGGDQKLRQRLLNDGFFAQPNACQSPRHARRALCRDNGGLRSGDDIGSFKQVGRGTAQAQRNARRLLQHGLTCGKTGGKTAIGAAWRRSEVGLRRIAASDARDRRIVSENLDF